MIKTRAKNSIKNRILWFFCAAALAFMGGLPSSAQAEMIDYPTVKLQSLDKATARTMTFEARVGSTIKFGPLYIKVNACRKSSPLEEPESASFLQIWEVTKNDQANWLFSGWMFASSPALSAMDHPIYDVWVLDCLETQGDVEDTEAPVVPEGAQSGPQPETGDKSAAEGGSADDNADDKNAGQTEQPTKPETKPDNLSGRGQTQTESRDQKDAGSNDR